LTSFDRLRELASQLKRETLTLYLAVHDPRTPWHAKEIIACVVGDALSPIDLIPDFTQKCVSDLPYLPNYPDVSANEISVMRKSVSGFRQV